MFFVLINLQVANAEKGWKKTGALVLERLWKSYGIIHAMLIAPCAQTGENVKLDCNITYLNKISLRGGSHSK